MSLLQLFQDRLRHVGAERDELIEQTYRLGDELAEDKMRVIRAEARVEILSEALREIVSLVEGRVVYDAKNIARAALAEASERLTVPDPRCAACEGYDFPGVIHALGCPHDPGCPPPESSL